MSRSLQTLTHPTTRFIRSPRPPTRHGKKRRGGGGDVCLALTLLRRHTLLIFSLASSASLTPALPSPCGDAAAPRPFNVLTRRASHSVWRPKPASFNATERGIKSAERLTNAARHHTCGGSVLHSTQSSAAQRCRCTNVNNTLRPVLRKHRLLAGITHTRVYLRRELSLFSEGRCSGAALDYFRFECPSKVGRR